MVLGYWAERLTGSGLFDSSDGVGDAGGFANAVIGTQFGQVQRVRLACRERNAERTASPLIPAFSPLRGEGVASGALLTSHPLVRDVSAPTFCTANDAVIGSAAMHATSKSKARKTPCLLFSMEQHPG
jgi:hypothetical protein